MIPMQILMPARHTSACFCLRCQKSSAVLCHTVSAHFRKVGQQSMAWSGTAKQDTCLHWRNKWSSAVLTHFCLPVVIHAPNTLQFLNRLYTPTSPNTGIQTNLWLSLGTNQLYAHTNLQWQAPATQCMTDFSSQNCKFHLKASCPAKGRPTNCQQWFPAILWLPSFVGHEWTNSFTLIYKPLLSCTCMDNQG